MTQPESGIKPEDTPNALMAKFAESPYKALAVLAGGVIAISALPLWRPIAALWTQHDRARR